MFNRLTFWLRQKRLSYYSEALLFIILRIRWANQILCAQINTVENGNIITEFCCKTVYCSKTSRVWKRTYCTDKRIVCFLNKVCQCCTRINYSSSIVGFCKYIWINWEKLSIDRNALKIYIVMRPEIWPKACQIHGNISDIENITLI